MSKDDLFLVHRLDAATSGLIILAKTKPAQQYLTRLFEEKGLKDAEEKNIKLRKIYSTLTHTPVPLGKIQHFQYKKTLGCQLLRKELSEEPSLCGDWKPVTINVIETKPLKTNYLESEREKHNQIFQSKIELITGKKHQIRAQLSATGCPVLKDTLYSPITGLTLESFAGEVQLMLGDPRFKYARSPETGLGLHAEELGFLDMDGEEIDIKCPPPWFD